MREIIAKIALAAFGIIDGGQNLYTAINKGFVRELAFQSKYSLKSKPIRFYFHALLRLFEFIAGICVMIAVFVGFR